MPGHRPQIAEDIRPDKSTQVAPRINSSDCDSGGQAGMHQDSTDSEVMQTPALHLPSKRLMQNANRLHIGSRIRKLGRVVKESRRDWQCCRGKASPTFAATVLKLTWPFHAV